MARRGLRPPSDRRRTPYGVLLRAPPRRCFGRRFPRQPLVAALLSMTILIALAAVFVVWRNWGSLLWRSLSGGLVRATRRAGGRGRRGPSERDRPPHRTHSGRNPARRRRAGRRRARPRTEE